jgi:hypothetical protein
MKLTKEQLKCLVCNAYGFADSYSSLLLGHESLFDDNTFTLSGNDDELMVFSYENAELVNGSLSLERVNGTIESLTVLVCATDGSGLTTELLK